MSSVSLSLHRPSIQSVNQLGLFIRRTDKHINDKEHKGLIVLGCRTENGIFYVFDNKKSQSTTLLKLQKEHKRTMKNCFRATKAFRNFFVIVSFTVTNGQFLSFQLCPKVIQSCRKVLKAYLFIYELSLIFKHHARLAISLMINYMQSVLRQISRNFFLGTQQKRMQLKSCKIVSRIFTSVALSSKTRMFRCCFVFFLFRV